MWSIAGNFRGRKLLQILRFCGYLLCKIGGMASFSTAKSKQSLKVFFTKNHIFPQFAKVFSFESFPLMWPLPTLIAVWCPGIWTYFWQIPPLPSQRDNRLWKENMSISHKRVVRDLHRVGWGGVGSPRLASTPSRFNAKQCSYTDEQNRQTPSPKDCQCDPSLHSSSLWNRVRWPNDAFQTADSEDATVGREGGGEEGGESQKGLRNYERCLDQTLSACVI